MRVAVKLAYNGRNYHGFARQPNVNTIEGKIRKILSDTGYLENLKKIEFRYASRTDKYVSALGNVIAFSTGKSYDCILDDINQHLDEIVFYGIKKVKSDFFPRYANHRIYSYYIKKVGFSFDRLIEGISFFVGTHNFSNFARIEKGKNPIRNIENITINVKKNVYQIDFYAQTYLWNQIRRIIAAIIKYSNNEIENNDIFNALENPTVKTDFGIATSEFLILRDIIYDFEFNYDVKWFKKFEILRNKIFNFLNILPSESPVR